MRKGMDPLPAQGMTEARRRARAAVFFACGSKKERDAKLYRRKGDKPRSGLMTGAPGLIHHKFIRKQVLNT